MAEHPNVSYDWIFRFQSDGASIGITYCHMINIERVEYEGTRLLVGAWQASEAGCEGAAGQHIRFSSSKDGGQTWSPSTCVMWGLQAIWSPILHFDQATGKLFLFYSESRKAASPGGDIKLVVSEDFGGTWGLPQLIYAHEADGGVPKVLANKLCITKSGSWLLPFWREPPDSWLEYPHYHPLQESPRPDRPPPPPGGAQESRRGSAGVLASCDGGSSWEARGDIHDPDTWLIENTVTSFEDPQGRESVLMMFRTGTGRIYQSVSSDNGATWSSPVPSVLPNPNSKIAMVKCAMEGDQGTRIAMAYNHSTKCRAPLHLAISDDHGGAWRHAAVIEANPTGNFAYPTPIEWADGTVKVAYTFWGEGIRMATITLPQEGSELLPTCN